MTLPTRRTWGEVAEEYLLDSVIGEQEVAAVCEHLGLGAVLEQAKAQHFCGLFTAGDWLVLVTEDGPPAAFEARSRAAGQTFARLLTKRLGRVEHYEVACRTVKEMCEHLHAACLADWNGEAVQ